MNTVAIDVGSGYTKAVSDVDVSFPSMVCVDTGADFFSVSVERVRFGGRTWLVGESAAHVATAKDREDTLTPEWAGSDGWVALLYAAIAKLGIQGGIRLVTGIPQALYNDRERRSKVLGKISGEHRFMFGEQEFMVNLSPTIIPQAAGAVFFQASLDESVLNDAVGVIDIGTYTTGFSVLENGRFVPLRSGGVSVGISELLLELRDHLLREHGLRMERSRLHAALQKGEVRNRDKTVDLKPDIQALARTVARPMLTAIDRAWGGGNDLRVLAAGGGGRYFIDAIRMVMPHAEIMSDGFWSVVRGMKIYLDSLPE